MKILMFIASLLVYGCTASYNDDRGDEWKTWKNHHGKSYPNTTEEKFRLMIFMDNKDFISKHNALAQKGEKGYSLKMNSYGDLLHHEFIHRMNGYNHEHKKHLGDGMTQITAAHVDLPLEVDWRKLGAVTEVKDQSVCGSCWAFSATGSLEGQHFRKSGKLVSLSEQNLVDCSQPYGNEGCNGGLMDNAFRYIKANGGIDTEKSYPYESFQPLATFPCTFNRHHIGATDKGFVDIRLGDEDALKAAVATVGPISVAIDAEHRSFQFYKEGIYDEEKCSNSKLNHAVLAVGYGVRDEPDCSFEPSWNTRKRPMCFDKEADFWLVKNSWGTEWGDSGYIKMARNKNNQCGIATAASYPVV